MKGAHETKEHGTQSMESQRSGKASEADNNQSKNHQHLPRSQRLATAEDELSIDSEQLTAVLDDAKGLAAELLPHKQPALVVAQPVSESGDAAGGGLVRPAELACATCLRRLPKLGFSKSQLANGAARRCKECIDAKTSSRSYIDNKVSAAIHDKMQVKLICNN